MTLVVLPTFSDHISIDIEPNCLVVGFCGEFYRKTAPVRLVFRRIIAKPDHRQENEYHLTHSKLSPESMRKNA